MSRQFFFCVALVSGFPRVSGDEPTLKPETWGALEFSPRERG